MSPANCKNCSSGYLRGFSQRPPLRILHEKSTNHGESGSHLHCVKVRLTSSLPLVVLLDALILVFDTYLRFKAPSSFFPKLHL